LKPGAFKPWSTEIQFVPPHHGTADSPTVEPTISASMIWSARGRWRRTARHKEGHNDDAAENSW
jgi:hypothetical protein